MRDIVIFSLLEIIYTILLIYFSYIAYENNSMVFYITIVWAALTVNTIALKESLSKDN